MHNGAAHAAESLSRRLRSRAGELNADTLARPRRAWCTGSDGGGARSPRELPRLCALRGARVADFDVLREMLRARDASEPRLGARALRLTR